MKEVLFFFCPLPKTSVYGPPDRGEYRELRASGFGYLGCLVTFPYMSHDVVQPKLKRHPTNMSVTDIPDVLDNSTTFLIADGSPEE